MLLHRGSERSERVGDEIKLKVSTRGEINVLASEMFQCFELLSFYLFSMNYTPETNVVPSPAKYGGYSAINPNALIISMPLEELDPRVRHLIGKKLVRAQSSPIPFGNQTFLELIFE